MKAHSALTALILCPAASTLPAVGITSAGPTRGDESASGMACADLARLALPDVRIISAEDARTPVPHCRLEGVIGREIGFAVWLPESWNGRFMMGGVGGYAGRIDNQANSLGALEKGYATAGTDAGHKGQGPDASWALGDLERIVNYGHVAGHRVTEVAKAVVAGRYGRPPQRSYFAGCSNGGRMALQAAQRYPEDFDAIIAGAPAYDFTRKVVSQVNIVRHVYPDADDLSQPLLSGADRSALAGAVRAACDATDGVEDGILSDPLSCDFDPGQLACDGDNADGCLSTDELAAVRAIYEGPRTPDGEPFYYGYPFGGEDEIRGWGMWLIGRKDLIAPDVPSLAFSFGVGFMRYFVMQDPGWTHDEYIFGSHETQMALLGATLNATATDLSDFRERGGKLLMYHGWTDSALSPLATIGYVEDVYAADPTARDDVRLFMMPGVFHCGGGPGPDRADFIAALETWDETGTPPEQLVAGFSDGNGGRTLCPHPSKAIFLGGDPRDPPGSPAGEHSQDRLSLDGTGRRFDGPPHPRPPRPAARARATLSPHTETRHAAAQADDRARPLCPRRLRHGVDVARARRERDHLCPPRQHLFPLARQPGHRAGGHGGADLRCAADGRQRRRDRRPPRAAGRLPQPEGPGAGPRGARRLPRPHGAPVQCGRAGRRCRLHRPRDDRGRRPRRRAVGLRLPLPQGRGDRPGSPAQRRHHRDRSSRIHLRHASAIPRAAAARDRIGQRPARGRARSVSDRQEIFPNWQALCYLKTTALD
ncbi:MAG: tannase/feruloyl esterase family alpha/beta hydrolase [Alphaproteobacteria bacterium]|nr:tannase/feruloyl esterase family alpha/beta hydrolase [Alphaproteobacteria bacterium]